MKTTKNIETLQFGKFYHIFNKANGTDKLFVADSDYVFFLKKLKRFLLPWINVWAYCLIPNHFHLLISVKEPEEISILFKNIKVPDIYGLSKAFSNFFNSYTKSYNKVHNRKGKLFLLPYKRKLIIDNSYLSYLICYIHRNPIHHGLTDNYTTWKYSSFNAVLSNKQTNIDRENVLSLFGSLNGFIDFHQQNKTKKGLKDYVLE